MWISIDHSAENVESSKLLKDTKLLSAVENMQSNEKYWCQRNVHKTSSFHSTHSTCSTLWIMRNRRNPSNLKYLKVYIMIHETSLALRVGFRIVKIVKICRK